MKLTAFFMIIGCLQLSAAGISQTVTIKVEKAPLEKVFEIVEQQTGFVFFYEKKLVQQSKPVTIEVKERPIQLFLEQLLRDSQLGYSIRNTTVSINRKDSSYSSLIINQYALRQNGSIKVTGIITGAGNLPLHGATIRIAGSEKYAITDHQGKFSIETEKEKTLIISYVGYYSTEWKVTGPEANIRLKQNDAKLEHVEVVISTGYQKFKPDEMVGSVSVVTKEMLQKQVGSNILQRLDGLVPGLQFVSKNTPAKAKGNPESVLGVNIRGWNTINGPTDPLIIVDDFPYYGDINNINPNDVESVMVLKDASSAGVWGARSANGVIVINTRKGKYNQRTNVNFGSIITMGDKPNLNKLPLLSTASYVDLELGDLQHSILDLNAPYQGTEVQRIVIARRKNLISATDSAAMIDQIKLRDSRREWDKYVYVHPLQQQYFLDISGGSSKMNWSARGGYNKSRDRTRGVRDAINFNVSNTYRISSKIEAQLGIDFNSSKSKSGAIEYNSSKIEGNSIQALALRPYLQLADQDGNPSRLYSKLKPEVLDTLGAGLLLDYYYYPLTNWQHDYTQERHRTYTVTGKLAYKPFPGLSLRLMVQALEAVSELTDVKDKESMHTRDLINAFSVINWGNRTIQRQLPIGDILKSSRLGLNTFVGQAIAEYTKKIGKHHEVILMAALDINSKVRTADGEVLLGYNENPLYHSLIDFNSTFQTLPYSNGFSLYTALGMDFVVKKKKTESRFLAGAASAHYTYKKKYTAFASIRREGFNTLGLSTNDRWTPLWNFGVRWDIKQERFEVPSWIDELYVKGSAGITGLVDVTRTSRTIGSINANSSTAPFPYISVSTPPNPNLRWEKHQRYNLSVSASVLKGRISAIIETYWKKGTDLYGNLIADFTQAPGATRRANASSMNGHGWELNLITRNFTGKFNWSTSFIWGRTISKVVNYLSQQASGSNFIYYSAGNDQGIQDFSTLFKGQELQAVRAIRSAGLNEKGELQYLVNGKPTTDINEVAKDIESNGANASSLQYYGSSTPRTTGSVINNFTWKNFGLTIQMNYELEFYFIKSTIQTGLNAWHKDWDSRWKKPGDEQHTTIPALNYVANGSVGSVYYQYRVMSDLIRRGDNLRIQNIQFDYMVPFHKKATGLQSLRFAFNVTGLGIIWRANKEKLDPRSELNYMTYSREVKSWSFSLTAGF